MFWEEVNNEVAHRQHARRKDFISTGVGLPIRGCNKIIKETNYANSKKVGNTPKGVQIIVKQ